MAGYRDILTVNDIAMNKELGHARCTGINSIKQLARSETIKISTTL